MPNGQSPNPLFTLNAQLAPGRKLIAVGLIDEPQEVPIPPNATPRLFPGLRGKSAGWITVTNSGDSGSPIYVCPEASIQGTGYGYPLHPFKSMSLYASGSITLVNAIGRDAKIGVWLSEQPVHFPTYEPVVLEYKVLAPIVLNGYGVISPPVDDRDAETIIASDAANPGDIFIGSPSVQTEGGIPIVPGEKLTLRGNAWICGRPAGAGNHTVHMLRGEVGIDFNHPGAHPYRDEDLGI